VTEAPDGPARRDEKGIAAVEARLAALGVTLDEVVQVAHEAGCALRRRCGHAGGVGPDPDRLGHVGCHRTWRPAGLVAAGGRLIRFGMPVDPGNLLVLGALGNGP
jgi:molybdenum cofactor cytidylyltransferase